MTALWLWACAGGGDTAADSGAAARWLGDVEEDEPPSFSADEVAAEVERVLAGLGELHAGPIVAAWDHVEAAMGEDCPELYEDDGYFYFYDTCETEAGASFEGYGGRYVYEAFEADGLVYDGEAVYAVANVVTADGASFAGAGVAQQLVATSGDGFVVWYSHLDPGFSWDGEGAEGTWLAEGLEPGIVLAFWELSGTFAQVQVSGGLGLAPGGVIEALAFEDVVAGAEEAAVSCPEELSGTVSVLDGEGHWIDLVFDGPEDLWAEATGCDGCGTAWYGGEALAEVCVDPSALASRDAAPW